MGFNKQEMIDALKLEIRIIEEGGYHPSVRDPRRELHTFRDSVTCLNVGLEEKVHPCSSCFLIDFVPPEFKNSNDDPCHKIPLNERGDTIESLERKGDPERTAAAVLAWLKKTVSQLEAEQSAEKRAGSSR